MDSKARAVLEPLMRYMHGYKLLLDRDAAEYFEVDLKTLNRCVKRHRNCFPPDFMFELNGGKDVDHALLDAARGFTEVGIDMLAGLLKSKKAITHSIENIREGTANWDRVARAARDLPE